MGIDEKIHAVQCLHNALTLCPAGHNAQLSDWFKPILQEVAELPKHRAIVQDIRRIVQERESVAPIARR